MAELPAHRSEAAKAAMRRSALRSTGVVALLIGAYALLPFRGEHWWIGAVVGLALLGAVLPVTVRRLRRVMSSEMPLLEAAEALVLLVTMLVVGFASIYYAMNDQQEQITGLATRVDSIYFTVTTLATVGFGDIHAQSQWSRVIVTLQMMINLAFIGVAVRVFLRVAQGSGDADTG
jgi:voltage-gated potassium channel